MAYEANTFTIPELSGISAKSIEEHIGLYNGYVKNFNAMTERIDKMLSEDADGHAHEIAELMRRRSFEFGGMRLHEHYFPQFEGGAKDLDAHSALGLALEKQFGSIDAALALLRRVAMMRGPGWALLYYDSESGQFHIGFTGEQHMGHFVTLPIVVALDVWEHAYILDHGAAGKGAYVDAFFSNFNWAVAEDRFAKLT